MTDTSQAAYADIAPLAPAIRALILDELIDGPATTEQLADWLEVDYSALQPRTSELRKLGQIVDSGSRGRNRSGKSAIVWKRA